MTALLQPVAPLVLLLEGGYNLAATAASVEACVRVLCGEQPARLQQPLQPTRVGLAAVQAAMSVQSRWVTLVCMWW
jgi:histone deacetylase 6